MRFGVTFIEVESSLSYRKNYTGTFANRVYEIDAMVAFKGIV